MAENFLQSVATPSLCTLGTPLSSVTLSNVEQAVTFDGVGFDATRTANATWTTSAGIEYLYYAGVPFGNTQDLGLATSSDGGVTWSKATDVPLMPRSTAPYWAKQRVVPIRVIHENGIFKLWYWGNNTNLFTDAGNIQGFGYATSADGLSWSAEENPIRVGSGSGEGARLLEVVKTGTRYLAYYDALSSGQATTTYVADSADGVNFVGPDQRITFGDNYRLVAATSQPGDSCILGIWQNRSTPSTVIAATSTNGRILRSSRPLPCRLDFHQKTLHRWPRRYILWLAV